MIKAYFENNKLIIDISWMEEKYKEIGKKITFTLYYGTEYTWNDWWDSYSIESKKEIEYSWKDEIVLEIDEVKKWYRWNKVFIWYYIDVNFWKKLLIFKDSKEIDISWREEVVFYSSDLKQNSKYSNNKDEYSYKKIFKNLSIIKKIFFLLFLIIPIIWAYLFFIKWEDYWIWISIFWIIAFLILFFTSGRWYFKWKLKENIQDWDNINSIIEWKINLDLEELQIQIFAYNSEKWNYEINEGSTTRTVWFNTQVWNVLLFDKTFNNILSWTDIQNILEWKLDFSEIYTNLFPNIEVTNDMWLFLNLEFRLISKNYKDIYLKQEMNLNKDKFISKNNIKNSSDKVENNNLNSDFFD